MSEPVGLRARKRERTRRAISDAAIAMFLADGFDAVSVADVAAAAEVSKPTLFRYFPTKEDLVLDRFADHRGEAARVVRGREPDEKPLAALKRHIRNALDERDPVTGLCDNPEVLAFNRLVFGTPSLAARLAQLRTYDTDELAGAFREATGEENPFICRLVAVQVVAVTHELAHRNWAKLAGGRSADDVHQEAVVALTRAFALLGKGAEKFGY
ncbi:TetR/AcrR family transcriptional regulator [Amycolatopsis sp. NPDC059027]|uniref:TetR/AcrR family transcriptional regulator n=1 Tax=Amycolatopsis sp. NPDC059027 TaxID=3346709 RepID=UPI00366AE092